LGYKLGQPIVIAHGAGDVSFSLHKDHPFRVVGILARTGTPVDRTVHVSLEGLDAVHAEHNAADALDPLAAAMHASEEASQGASGTKAGSDGHAESKRTVSAFLVGLKSRGAALSVQRLVNEYPQEALTAILPGPTLQEVWDIVGAAEKTLLAVSPSWWSWFPGGDARRVAHQPERAPQEMAILRSVGALGRCTYLA
jgi:putative ABC transport system permease protein